MKGLRATSYELGARSWDDEVWNFKKLGTTQEHEDRDKDHLGVSLGL